MPKQTRRKRTHRQTEPGRQHDLPDRKTVEGSRRQNSRLTRRLLSKTALNKLKEAHKAQDIAGIDAAMAELNSVFQAASQEMYNAQNAQGGAQPGPDFGQQTGGNAGNNKQDGGVTDVDFEEVK